MSSPYAVPMTWMDVARQFAECREGALTPPAGVARVAVAWHGVVVTLDGDVAESTVNAWLGNVFPGRFNFQAPSIELEGPFGPLGVEFDRVKEGGKSSRLSLGIVDGIIDFGAATFRTHPREVRVVSCLSVKGGTGRTTTAIAFAMRWAERERGRVLLVDADIEAPGISYLFESVAGIPKISLEDVVVLAHSDPDASLKSTMDFASERLKDQFLDNALCVLPLRRCVDDLASSAIRSEHLSTPERPFALADILSGIAARLGCVGVVVDVRAGLVPIGAGLALDPDVSPIVVTTLSNQSIRATATLGSFIAREIQRAGWQPRKPLLVVNRVPAVFKQSGMDQHLVTPLIDDLVEALGQPGGESGGISDSLDEVELLAQVSVPELPDIQVMARNWSEFVSQLKSSGFVASAGGVFDSWISSELQLSGDVPVARVNSTSLDLAGSQKKLRSFADQLIAAENLTHQVPKPLVTNPLHSLVKRFQSQLPIAISEGAKGTGKTLAARYFVSRETWSSVSSELVGLKGSVEAVMLPVVGSAQASESAQKEIDAARTRCASYLGTGSASPYSETTSYLREKIASNLGEREWVDLWLDVIAWSAGYEAGRPGVGADFLAHLKANSKHAVAVLEGLEELYNSVSHPGVSAAMRAAFVSLPQRLRSETQRPLGLLVFARRDTVEAAVLQNLDQFRREYSPFSLSWSEGDVLELAAWLAAQSGAIPELWNEQFSTLPDEDKKVKLELLWGKKLGPQDEAGRRTREAYTATWIIAVLSDLRGRLVPRDLVRLLATAAAVPASDDERRIYARRLLVPRSIRAAVEPTSEKKVQETKEEIPEIAGVLNKFKSNPDEASAPLTQLALDKLNVTDDEVKLLVRHGIVFGDQPPFEVPELFRRGLGLRHAGARRSVVNLYLKARQRYPAD